MMNTRHCWSCRATLSNLVVCLLLLLVRYSRGLLYPRESETRERTDLSGIWNFRSSGTDQKSGFVDRWFDRALSETGLVIRMPVPSSYNDITQDKSLRDYIGWVWYDREFFVPHRWKNDQEIVLRFGGVHYSSMVWVNSVPAVNHTGGHLPFEAVVTTKAKYGEVNRVTVAVNNTMSHDTLPTGEVTYQSGPLYPPGYHTQTLFFDFFNYAGIHRPVFLYTRPAKAHIQDILIIPRLENSFAVIYYNLTIRSSIPNLRAKVQVLDENGTVSGEFEGREGTIKIKNPKLWWPIHMHPQPGYQYVLRAALSADGKEIDVCREKFGVREVQITATKFIINRKAFYFAGFGRHEDSDIRGKGVDLPLITKDFNLIEWMGANSFRTSHYPYAEEIMDECDARGIVVIDECPAVGLNHDPFFKSKALLELHIEMLRELVARDKNRPSVVLWSVANEPKSQLASSAPYFKQVVDALRSFDPTKRHVTAALHGGSLSKDHVGHFMDVICMNRYYGWYTDTGHTEVIKSFVVANIRGFHDRYQKPVIVTEYGAGTIAGLHKEPSFVFTEEFQADLLEKTHEAFDELKGVCLVGEMIWNFADFMTDQDVGRVVGNKKGIFTRQRQPKAAAHSLRRRYNELNKMSISMNACS